MSEKNEKADAVTTLYLWGITLISVGAAGMAKSIFVGCLIFGIFLLALVVFSCSGEEP